MYNIDFLVNCFSVGKEIFGNGQDYHSVTCPQTPVWSS